MKTVSPMDAVVLKRHRPARIRGGVSSGLHIGETNEAVPPSMPSTNRAAISQVRLCATAEAGEVITSMRS